MDLATSVRDITFTGLLPLFAINIVYFVRQSHDSPEISNNLTLA